MDAAFAFVEDHVLRNYIKETFGPNDLFIGSNYELVCALLIKLLFEDLYSAECMIGFKCKRTYDKSAHVPLTNKESCKYFFENIVDDDTHIDFCVSPITTFNDKRNKIFSWTFQVKRFGKFQNQKSTDGFLNYLLKVKTQYAPNDSALVVFFDGHKGINSEQISKDIRLSSFPFTAIFFIDINKDKSEFWRLCLGQLWPIPGYNAYDAIKALKEGVLENVSFKYF